MDTQYHLIAEETANAPVQAISVKSSADILLPYTMPQAEYMYGCSATAVGMLLGYYDLYGYSVNGTVYDFSNLIAGDISVDSRGSDGKSIYDMKDPSVLANFIASTSYIDRFFNQDAQDEKTYSFVNGDPSLGLNISDWDCLADYLGTGQYWRRNADLSTTHYSLSLSELQTTSQTYNLNGEIIPIRYADFKYGLSLYVESRGFELDAENTQSFTVDEFTFDDFIAEIDAGRSVLISMTSYESGHMVLAYGYNAATQEIIFDDTYRSDCRMSWDSTYLYSGKQYSISGATTVVFDTSELEPDFVPGVWLTDWEEAQKWAQAKNVPILLYYGNRDTCGYCCYLEDEVFSSEEFQNYVLSGSVILLKNTTVPGISAGSGTPNCILIDPDGTRLDSRSGYQSGSQENWMNWFSSHVESAGTVDTPDLIASSVIVASKKGAISNSDEISASDKIYLSFDVVNQGAKGTGNKFKVKILVDGKYAAEVEVSALSAGASARVKDIDLGSWKSGTHKIEIQVDPEKQIVEKKKQNNILEESFFIRYSDSYRIVSSYEKMTSVTSSQLLIVSGGSMYASNGALVRDSVVDGGQLWVYSGGRAENLSAANGYVLFSSAATGSGLVLNSSARLSVYGTINDITLNNDATCYLSSGGKISNVTNSGGTLFVTTSCSLSGAKIYNGGYLRAYCHNDTWEMSDIEIFSGAVLDNYFCDLTAAGTMHNITVHSGGTATLAGKLSGSIRLGGKVSIYPEHTTFAPDTKLILDISQRTTADEYIFAYTPSIQDCDFNLVISETQQTGTYALLGNAADFNGSFTVCSTSGICYSSDKLSLDSPVKAGDVTIELTSASYLRAGVYRAGIYHSGAVLSVTSCDIKYGMSAVDATVASRASMYIGLEGTGSNLKVSHGGYLRISSGGAAYGTTLSGSKNISANAQGAQNEAYHYAYCYVSSGGKAVNTKVSDAGSLIVSSGGTAADVEILSGGYATISKGSISGIKIHSGGSARGYAAGTICDVTLLSGGNLYLSSGSVLTGKLNINGCLMVSSGGVISDADLNIDLTGWSNTNDYQLCLYKGTSIDFNTLAITVTQDLAPGNYCVAYAPEYDFSGKNFTVKQGNTVLGTVSTDNSLNSGNATYNLRKSGYFLYFQIVNDSLLQYADLSISHSNITQQNGTPVLLDNQNVQLAFTVTNSGAVTAAMTNAVIYVNGEISRTISLDSLQSGESREYICDLGKFAAGIQDIKVVLDANNTITEKDENNNEIVSAVLVSSAAITPPSGVWQGDNCLGRNVSSLTQSTYTSTMVYADGKVGTLTQNYTGYVYVSSGGSIDLLKFNSNSYAFIQYGGVVSSAVMSSGGSIFVSSGGLLSNLHATSGCTYLRGGTIGSAVIAKANTTYISHGGVISRMLIESGGKCYIYQNGSAVDTNIASGGIMYASSRTVINQLNVANGGSAVLYSGAVLSGSQTYAGTVLLSGSVNTSNATFNLDISSRTTAQSYIVNNLALLNASDFHVTVSATQAVGIYTLAAGAANFKGSITICSTSGSCLNAIKAGDSICDETTSRCYRLINSGSYLKLEVAVSSAVTPPPVINYPVNIYSGGTLVSSGNFVSNAVIGRSQSIHISSGGSAVKTEIASGGVMYASSGAVINQLNVANSGSAVMHSGAVLSGSQTYAGTVLLSGSVNTSNAAINLDISSRTTAQSYIVNNLALLNASDFHVTVSATQAVGIYTLAAGAENFKGTITICSASGSCLNAIKAGDSICDDTTSRCYTLINSGSYLKLEVAVSSAVTPPPPPPPSPPSPPPPVVSNYPVNIYSGGTLVSSGNFVSNAVIGRSQNIHASSGGSAVKTNITSGGVMYASSGAVINQLNVANGGSAVLYSGAVLSGSQTYAGTVLLLGSVNTSNATFNLDISSRTTAQSYIVNNLALLNASDFHVTVSATQAVGIYTLAAGAANFKGSITICSTSGSCLNAIKAGDSICDETTSRCYTLINSGSYLKLEVAVSSAVTPPPPVVSNYPVNIYSGGTLVSGGNVVSNAAIGRSQSIHISSGGSAVKTNITSGGVMYASSGALVNRLNIVNGGSAVLNSGAILTGSHTYAGTVLLSGTVNAYSAKIYFDISGKSSGNSAIINDLNALAADNFYVTVSATQAEGSYILAENAASFRKTISVTGGSVNRGTLTVNGTAVEWEGLLFSLKEESGTLSLTVATATAEPVLYGTADGISFTDVPGEIRHVEYSTDDFAHVLKISPSGNAVDTCGMPSGTYQWQVCTAEKCYQGEDIVSDNNAVPQQFISDADGNIDVFFADTDGIWEKGYGAQHQGSGNWQGTRENVLLEGKNKIADVFTGSTDANILLLTDSANGDALFIDDIYTAFGNQVRLTQIHEIRAGAGNDIVDMTSQQFACVGNGATIYGGAGDDTIWANSGNNTLFGDAGNDRLVGANGNDIITGGAGNDSMHGGGGDDIFCFGANFGQDTVEQLSGGKVTLHFENGSEDNWNAQTLTYTDGVNSVTVSGVTEVNLVFGGTAPVEGAFLDAASEKVFEDKSKNMIA